MEKTLARIKFEDLDVEEESCTSELDGSGGEEGEEERETRLLFALQSRKGKKSGGFQSMGLSHAVFKGVMRKGYRVPTPIQRKCIPLVMDGKDVVAMARTGSGKTAAFLIPMFEKLKTHSAKIGARALILSPTRELATQTLKFTKELGKFTNLRATLVLGGDRMEDQFAAIHENPDIIIATPGRFLHLVVEMELRLTSLQYVVFDEADRLFEMGFSEQLHEIIRRLPESKQTLLFSATLPKLLVDFAKAGLKDPVLVRLDVDSKLSEQLKQTFLATRADDKPAVLLHLLRQVISPTEQTVVFMATKHHVEYLRELLLASGINASYTYSSLDQTARKINVAKFVNKKVMVMLVTDVAARGIDIPMLDNVVNYNFPAKPKLFVHRVGRVARAGRSGSAYSLVSPDEAPYLLDLHLFLGRPLKLAGPSETSRLGVYGSVPQSVLDEEEDLIRHAHSTASDLVDMKKVSENAQKQYVKSRPLPAPESVKRSKKLPTPLPLHPLFVEHSSGQEEKKAEFISSLKSYRPSQTILEIHSTAKSTAKQVMKTKRQYHGSVVAGSRQQRDHPTPSSSSFHVGADEKTMVESRDEDLEGFLTEESVRTAANMRRRRRKGVRKAVKDENYLRYMPADLHSEMGLSLCTSFDQQTAGAVLDLDGDEGTDMKRSKSQRKWDRKRKKFVSETGKEARKKMKMESGGWISSSYKSNAYREWMEQHKMEGVLAGEEEEEAEGRGGGKRGHLPKAHRRGRGSGEGARGRRRGMGRGAGDLKTKTEILKKRRLKEFQDTRRKLKAKKRKTTGGQKGKAPRTGTRQR